MNFDIDFESFVDFNFRIIIFEMDSKFMDFKIDFVKFEISLINFGFIDY